MVDSTLLKQYGDKYKYYKDIPDSEEDKIAAHLKIEEAMYKLGQLYSQKLNEADSAIKTFEGMLDRYEDSEYTLRARYALYKLYKEQRNPVFNVHQNYILNEHPNTIYALLIQGRDPNELKKDEEDLAFVYDGLYSSYQNKEYETSLGFSEYLLQQPQFLENKELDLAELHYIRGMSYGYTGQQDSLQVILTRVVNRYPEADVTPIAQKTLNFIKNGVPATVTKTVSVTPAAAGGESKDATLADPNNPLYKGFLDKPKPNDKIFVLMFIDKNNISKADVTGKVSNFNKGLYKDARLKVFTFLYQQTHLLPYVSNFKTTAAADKYIADFMADPVAQEVLTTEGDKIFYISHSNFKVAYGQKRMPAYIDYFSNILKK